MSVDILTTENRSNRLRPITCIPGCKIVSLRPTSFLRKMASIQPGTTISTISITSGYTSPCARSTQPMPSRHMIDQIAVSHTETYDSTSHTSEFLRILHHDLRFLTRSTHNGMSPLLVRNYQTHRYHILRTRQSVGS